MTLWKKREQDGARFFHTRRNPLSGGNSGHTRSDSLHPRIFLEQKCNKASALWTLFKSVLPKAKRENKIPVLIQHQPNQQGFLITIHSNDFVQVALEVVEDRNLVIASLHESLSKGDGKRPDPDPVGTALSKSYYPNRRRKK